MKKVNIIFEDGHMFTGEGFGAATEALGEVVFTTSSASYIEDITDPCYTGQIIMPTFPSLGNYGMIFQDRLSEHACCAGVITRSACAEPSNFRSEGRIGDYLRDEGVPGVQGVDTRAITRLLRDGMPPRAIITTRAPEEVMEELKAFNFNAYDQYSNTSDPHLISPAGDSAALVALVDLGAPRRQLDALTALGCEVLLAPMGTPVSDLILEGCQGVVFSEGPGDPSDYAQCLPGIKAHFGKLPLLGIGLGHELMALSCDMQVTRLCPGHRGGNVPVRELETGRVNITTQNHGYAVLGDFMPSGAQLLYENCNDGSVEGLLYEDVSSFSMQFHPGSGSRAPQWGYKRFLDMITEG